MKEINYTQINEACLAIAEKIKQRSGENFRIAAVSRGGLIPAAIVAHILHCKDIRFIRLSSYADNHQQAEMVDTTVDEVANDENTYIIDDICDSGETVLYLRKKYPAAQIYTLINKNRDILPDYFPVSEEKGTWIHFPWEMEE